MVYRRFMFRLRSVFQRKKLESNMSDEIRLHLEMQAEVNRAAGMSPDEAQHAAWREFGGVEQVKEAYRDEFRWNFLEDCWRDLRHSVRSLWREKSFTITVLVIFALCLAANVAIFSLVNGILLRPLPFRDPGRLVTVYDSYPAGNLEHGGASPLHYLERTASVPAFEETAAFINWTVTLGGSGTPESTALAEVTPSFFRLLGVSAALGRTLTAEDASDGRDHVVVISDQVWRNRFNADPAVVGQMIRIDTDLFTVIGVMPPNFHFLSQPANVWTPLHFSADDLKANQRYRTGMEMIGRLQPGATLTEAQAQVDALNAHPIEGDTLAELVHKMGYHTVIRDLHADHVATLKPVLVLLQASVFCLLLIGTINVSILMLLRTDTRGKEFGVRRALGASGFHLARALVVETLLLAFGGGSLGLGLGAVALRSLGLLWQARVPIDAVPALDVTTGAVAIGASLALGFLLAVPAVARARKGNLSVTLSRESRSGTATRGVQRFRQALIVGQIALAFVLLAATCLLGVSFARVLAVNPGFRSENILTGTIALPWSNYQKPGQRVAFVEKLLTALRAQPGVTSVGISTRLPFSGADTNDFSPFVIEGRSLSPDEQAAVHYNRGVGGDYFSTLGVPLLKGRFFNDTDALQDNKVCVIDDEIARRYWPNGDAVGHRLTFDVIKPKKEDYSTIVGVVGSVKQNGLDDRNGFGIVYYPNVLFPALGLTVVVRTVQAPEAAASALRGEVLLIDPELPVTDLKTMAARVSESLDARRIPLLLAAIFAGVALVLAATGIYGVLAYQVSQRRREIGVRMALGAQPKQILHQFLCLGVRLLAIGLPLGFVGAWFASRLMAGLLFGVGPMNPLVIAGTAMVLGGVAMLACWLPSHRASQVAPAEALRAS
jgi:predicted permease